MKSGFHLWMLNPKSSQNSRCTHIHQTSWESFNKHCLHARMLMGQEWSAGSEIYGKRDRNSATSVLWNTEKKLCRAIQNKRYGMLTSDVVFFHGSARSHTAAGNRSRREHFNWKLFDHPLYCPDLTPRYYHLFTYLKNWLGSQHFSRNEQLMEGVKTWLSSQAADCFDTGI
jgi:hypothetical protein